MRAIILAAGEGKRLRPLTSKTPKSLVKIEGFTMLEYQLNLFNKNKIKPTVVAGYLSEKIIEVTNDVIINDKYASTNLSFAFQSVGNVPGGNGSFITISPISFGSAIVLSDFMIFTS